MALRCRNGNVWTEKVRVGPTERGGPGVTNDETIAGDKSARVGTVR